MAHEQKPGTAAVFANRKKTNDKQPDWKGNINVLGADLEIAIWDKIDKNGKPYRFVSINEPYSRPAAQQRPLSGASPAPEHWGQLPTSDLPPDDEEIRF